MDQKKRYSSAKHSAKERGLYWNISYEKWLTIISQPCVYCGEDKAQRGLDRESSEIGYYLTNVVSCCWRCNRMKSNLPVQDFIDHITRIIEHFEKE